MKISDDDAERLYELDKGAIILTAHVGNWQAMMSNLPALKKPVNIMIRPADNPAVKEYLKVDETQRFQMKMINPEDGVTAAAAATAALSAGELVSIMGDRFIDPEHTVEVSFLGAPARFPNGPFILANACRVPILVLLTRRNGPCDYTIAVHQLPSPDPGSDKTEAVLQLASGYCSLLEIYLTENPCDWGNFVELWGNPRHQNGKAPN